MPGSRAARPIAGHRETFFQAAANSQHKDEIKLRPMRPRSLRGLADKRPGTITEQTATTALTSRFFQLPATRGAPKSFPLGLRSPALQFQPHRESYWKVRSERGYGGVLDVAVTVIAAGLAVARRGQWNRTDGSPHSCNQRQQSKRRCTCRKRGRGARAEIGHGRLREARKDR